MGHEHDWAALELGAWLAAAHGAPLRLIGVRGPGWRGRSPRGCSSSEGRARLASLITRKDIKDGSVTGNDIKNSSLTGKDVKDKSLTKAD